MFPGPSDSGESKDESQPDLLQPQQSSYPPQPEAFGTAPSDPYPNPSPNPYGTQPSNPYGAQQQNPYNTPLAGAPNSQQPNPYSQQATPYGQQQNPYGQPPSPYGQSSPNPYPAPNAYGQQQYNPYSPGFTGYSTPIDANRILTYGILSFICFGFILGPIAVVQATNGINAIDSGQADPSVKGKLIAARICGIIGTILWVIRIFSFVAGFVLHH